MDSHKRRLGKGLEALIPNSEEKTYVLELDMSKIQRNPLQPRKKFDDTKIEELSKSIEENGIIQPIIVRKVGTKYEIIAGERRFRAAQKLELKKVPVIVKDAAEDKSLELAVIENIQREDLNPVEEGEAYKLLIDKYAYTQERLANKLGKKRSTITNKLRILKLPLEIKNSIKNGDISSGHARAILSIKDEKEQNIVAKQICEENLTVREVETIAKTKKQVIKKETNVNKRIELLETEKKLCDFLGTKVKIKECKNQKGKVEIEFYSEGDLERIIETIGMNE